MSISQSASAPATESCWGNSRRGLHLETKRSTRSRMLLGMSVVAMLVWVAPLHADEDAKKEVFALDRKAEALEKAGKLAEAAKVSQEAVRKAKTAYGKEAVETAFVTNNLANLYQSMGQYAKAEPLLRRSL